MNFRLSRSAPVFLLLLSICGCKVEAPGHLETWIVTRGKHELFIRNKAQKNPLPATPDTLASGREAFSHYCVACHGTDGRNTGVPFAEHMSPPLPALDSADVQSYTDGQLKWILDYGIRPSGMPASKGILSDDELWAVVYYLRHLPPAGSQGVPELYAQ